MVQVAGSGRRGTAATAAPGSGDGYRPAGLPMADGRTQGSSGPGGPYHPQAIRPSAADRTLSPGFWGPLPAASRQPCCFPFTCATSFLHNILNAQLPVFLRRFMHSLPLFRTPQYAHLRKPQGVNPPLGLSDRPAARGWGWWGNGARACAPGPSGPDTDSVGPPDSARADQPVP